MYYKTADQQSQEAKARVAKAIREERELNMFLNQMFSRKVLVTPELQRAASRVARILEGNCGEEGQDCDESCQKFEECIGEEVKYA